MIENEIKTNILKELNILKKAYAESQRNDFKFEEELQKNLFLNNIYWNYQQIHSTTMLVHSIYNYQYALTEAIKIRKVRLLELEKEELGKTPLLKKEKVKNRSFTPNRKYPIESLEYVIKKKFEEGIPYVKSVEDVPKLFNIADFNVDSFHQARKLHLNSSTTKNQSEKSKSKK